MCSENSFILPEFSTKVDSIEIILRFQEACFWEHLQSTACMKTTRGSQRRCSLRKGVFRNFTRFTGKHLSQSLFLMKLLVSACNFIKKGALAKLFSCEFCETSKNTFFTEHLWTTASGLRWKTFLPKRSEKLANFLKFSSKENFQI